MLTILPIFVPLPRRIKLDPLLEHWGKSADILIFAKNDVGGTGAIVRQRAVGRILGGEGPKPRKVKSENPRVLRDFSNSLLPYKAFLFLKLFFPRTNYNSNYIVLSYYY